MKISTRRPRIQLALSLCATLASSAACRHECRVEPYAGTVDPSGNGVLEPNETVDVEPTWSFYSRPGTGCAPFTPCATSAPLALAISSFTGPAGAYYTVEDGLADYGQIPFGTTRSCTQTGDCYRLSITMPGVRPVQHWDATFVEDSVGSSPLAWIGPMGLDALTATCPTTYHVPATWTLHVGASFIDVSTAGPFYPFIENLFHHQVTGGCGAGLYCPGSSIPRAQMSVFLLKSEYGTGYSPPACTGIFTDTPCPGPFTDWVEQIYHEGVIPPCAPTEFCPNDNVSRRNMARWLLRTSLGTDYQPPAAQGLFADVPVTEVDAPWIEDLYHRGITAGCSANPLLYCPDNPNTRAQMAVFIDKTFALALY